MSDKRNDLCYALYPYLCVDGSLLHAEFTKLSMSPCHIGFKIPGPRGTEFNVTFMWPSLNPGLTQVPCELSLARTRWPSIASPDVTPPYVSDVRGHPDHKTDMHTKRKSHPMKSYVPCNTPPYRTHSRFVCLSFGRLLLSMSDRRLNWRWL